MDVDISQAVTAEATSAEAIGHLIRTMRAELSLVRGSVERMEGQVLPLLEDNVKLGDAITAAQNNQFALGTEAALAVMEVFSRDYPDAVVNARDGWSVTFKELIFTIRDQVETQTKAKETV